MLHLSAERRMDIFQYLGFKSSRAIRKWNYVTLLVFLTLVSRLFKGNQLVQID